ncbi:MAG TPA: tetratricopeptide repeat protein [Burkholderiaceae bacterium]
MTPAEHAMLERLFGEAKRLIAAGDRHAALGVAQQAWNLAPRHADCSNLVGLCAIALGDGPTAEQCWRQAVALNPQTIEARINLARFFRESGRASEAEEMLRQTLALHPEHADAHLLLGHLLVMRKDTEAAQHYRQALTLDPGLAEAWANLALELEKEKNWSAAETHHRRALALAPSSAQIHINLGNLMARLHRHDEAQHEYRSALAQDPSSAVAHSSLGVLQADLGLDAEAELSLRSALQLNPGYQLARYNLALLLLAQGRFAEGWPLHEARNHPSLPEPNAPVPSLPGSQWQGQSLAGKSLLIWPEQGYGDMIQFCRYLPLLKAGGAARVDLVCRKAQVALLKTLEGVDSVVALDEAGTLVGSHDYWALTMSLPLYCGTTLADLPSSLPYLRAPQERIAAWRGRMPGKSNGKKIGLAWRGNVHHSNDDKRSLPDFSVLQPLLSAEEVTFFSLQKDNRETLPAQVVDLGVDIDDFADSAAIVEQLDLLITVDTAVAHLAGALGKPCWIMLPSWRSDWRWLRGRSDSPWYPGVVRLYRQAAGESWQAVVARILHDLTHDLIHDQQAR